MPMQLTQYMVFSKSPEKTVLLLPNTSGYLDETMITDLTRTDLHLIRLHGVVDEEDGVISARTPTNPTYRWGNFLLLPAPPQASDLEHLVRRATAKLKDQPESLHAMIRWDGDSICPELESHASRLGLQNDPGMAMRATRMEPIRTPGVTIRQINFDNDWPDIECLNRTCDPLEMQGESDYVLFKKRLRDSWRVWAEESTVSWWGGFMEGRLVGQLGLVCCPNGLGRLQSVETHPDFRRRGVCTTLVAHVVHHALQGEDCNEVVLGIEPKSDASRIYHKLGFALEEWQHGLVIIDASTIGS